MKKKYISSVSLIIFVSTILFGIILIAYPSVVTSEFTLITKHESNCHHNVLKYSLDAMISNRTTVLWTHIQCEDPKCSNCICEFTVGNVYYYYGRYAFCSEYHILSIDKFYMSVFCGSVVLGLSIFGFIIYGIVYITLRDADRRDEYDELSNSD